MEPEDLERIINGLERSLWSGSNVVLQEPGVLSSSPPELFPVSGSAKETLMAMATAPGMCLQCPQARSSMHQAQMLPGPPPGHTAPPWLKCCLQEKRIRSHDVRRKLSSCTEVSAEPTRTAPRSCP